jgi:hypothetical protein
MVNVTCSTIYRFINFLLQQPGSFLTLPARCPAAVVRLDLLPVAFGVATFAAIRRASSGG